MRDFTPLSAVAGGALIGLAAALLVVLNGRIAGISGIVGGALAARRDDLAWRLLFVAGLVAGAWIAGPAAGLAPAIRIDAGTPLLLLGGLLVGFGTRLGGGCTSGHGVCGVARLSRRALAATGLFMAAGAAVVFVVRHLAGG
ncbi:MAG: YeeE/YedE family protein [Rhodospirillaceae bacterium]|nr:YeeE/YedE family protein [Rhodospirillaceae bacterium]